MAETESSLIGEQMRHLVDLLRMENQMLARRVEILERESVDHEERLRAATEGVVQFRMWLGLASAGSGAMSIVALIKAFLEG